MWYLIDGRGELASKEDFISEIGSKLVILEKYWDGAWSSGHPKAVKEYVTRMNKITISFSDEFDEDEIGYLDREPQDVE